MWLSPTARLREHVRMEAPRGTGEQKKSILNARPNGGVSRIREKIEEARPSEQRTYSGPASLECTRSYRYRRLDSA